MKMDNPTCQYGTPNGTLIIIAIGDVNGIIDNQRLNPLSGLLIIVGAQIMPNNKGSETMVMN